MLIARSNESWNENGTSAARFERNSTLFSDGVLSEGFELSDCQRVSSFESRKRIGSLLPDTFSVYVTVKVINPVIFHNIQSLLNLVNVTNYWIFIFIQINRRVYIIPNS